MANIKNTSTKKTNGKSESEGTLSPWRDLDRPFLSLRDVMGRMFNEGQGQWDPFENLTNLTSRMPMPSRVFPKVDISETDAEVRIVANVPGIDPEKIDIEVGDDYISLAGTMEKERQEETKDKKVYRYEREYGEFRRTFSLPAKVLADKVTAKTKDGVLTITLPKAEEEKKKVKIVKE